MSAARIFAAGCAAAAFVVLAGFAFELARLGTSEAAAAAEIERDVRQSFARITSQIERAARDVAHDPAVARAMAADAESDDTARAVFDAAAAAVERFPEEASLLAATIYDNAGAPRAWAGRASDLPLDRTKGGATLFVTPSPLGLRLVYLEPIAGPAPDRPRLGAVAAEYSLAPTPASTFVNGGGAYAMRTARAPVALHLHGQSPEPVAGAAVFTIAGGDGRPLLDAAVAYADLAGHRVRIRRGVAGIAIAVCAVTILLLAGPLLDRRAAAGNARRELTLTAAVAGTVLAGCALLWLGFAIAPWATGAASRTAFKLWLGGVTGAAVVATLVSAAVRLRLALRTRRRWMSDQPLLFVLVQLACGGIVALVLIRFEVVLGRSIDPAAVDLRHFSLHPWSLPRLATLSGILLGHAAVLWFGALTFVLALARWRLPRGLSRHHAVAVTLWILPAIALAWTASAQEWRAPAAAIVLGAVTCAVAALVTPRLVGWYRRATVVSRILALFMAFLVPALLVYPTVHFFSELSVRQLIAAAQGGYAMQAMTHPQTLQDRLRDALREIDAMPVTDLLPRASASPSQQPASDLAFRIWRQTVLARLRLTSDVELYDEQGDLVSRFALNFPEYTAVARMPESLGRCQWDIFGEAQTLGGAQERNTLHAQRSVCVDGRPVATIVVHVVFDFRTLPFISSQSPYFDLFGGSSASALEGPPGGEVEFAAYGWGLTTIYTSGHDAWPLDPDLFTRVYRSRAPFWTVADKGGKPYHVYFANDRQFIYALGYPIPSVFDHLVRLAELTTLAAAGYVVILVGSMLFSRAARLRVHTGRSLLREIRASFYRKLFLAFVLASIVPVLTLALVIRTYFASLLLADIQQEASRTAAVAQRVIEASDELLRRGAQGATLYADDLMVSISQLIDQDVNVFYGAELFATSERDLFASGLLPTRTPDKVYRATVLQRLPSFVTEDHVGTVPYILAASPVRSGGRNAVLTVPLAYRQHEVEREIDDLDRGVHLAALFFILLGAAIGLSMAERIADPIRQLTRATGRIARGEFDERIAVRSSDELRRLVDAFNGMAAELKAQRAQLEKTHRLEAWAEMARQVAHEIKNPLTPIQLSAEHLQRVHADRGEPMGAVLQGCVDSILSQVRLLRQIAAEFSSFASSPTARRAPADLVQLVNDVVEPYRVGLESRITLQNEVAPPLPLVLVDRRLIARALANIVENALHAMPARGRLRISAHVDGDSVVIDVEDTGVGMDAEALERVFEPYFSTKTTGTGLGLPIARRNVELSGGTIAVDSEKGRGTSVTIRLPVAVAAAERG